MIKTVAKWILAILVIIFLGWLVLFRFNIGGILASILGLKKPGKKPNILDSGGNVVGEAVAIKPNKNPFRDKSKLELENGDVIDLPPGVQDIDVKTIIIEHTEIYDVIVKPSKMSKIFDIFDQKK